MKKAMTEIDKAIAEDFPEAVEVVERIGVYEYNANGVCLNPDEVVSKTVGEFIYKLSVARTREGWDYGVYYSTKSHVPGMAVGLNGANINSSQFNRRCEAMLAGAVEILKFFNDQMKEVPQLKKHKATLNSLKYWIELWKREAAAPKAIYVSSDVFDALQDKIDLVAITQGNLKYLVVIDGKTYCLSCTVSSSTGTKAVFAYEAIHSAAWQGIDQPLPYLKHLEEIRQERRERSYNGLLLQRNGAKYVLIGQEIEIKCKNRSTTQKLKNKMPRKSKKQAAATFVPSGGPIGDDFVPQEPNAVPDNPAEMPKTQFRMLSIHSIQADPDQPRKFFDQQAQDELTESIKANGILQPILVRPSFVGEGWYTLVCGERRLRSAKEALLKEVPAVIRKMDDQEALELQIVENLQRKNIHPMEEAAGFKSLHDNERFSIEEIAGRVGKSHAYVAQRLKLNNLVEDFQEMFFRDLITLTEANGLARMAPESQQSILGEILKYRRKDWRQDDKFSVGNIDGYLREELHNLSNANFKLADAKLYPEAGPCTACPHNSANAPLLFPDIQKGKYCSNSICFNIKSQRAYKQNIEKYAADPDIIFVKRGYCDADDEQKVAAAEEMGLKVFEDSKVSIVTKPDRPRTEAEYVEDNYKAYMPWEDAEDEAEEQRNIEQAKKEAREGYANYIKNYKEEAEEYDRKKAEGLIRKAYVIAGYNSGKLVEVEVRGSAKKEDLNDALSIDEEIARIKTREERNQEIDREKIFTDVMVGLIDSSNWTGELTKDEEVAAIILLSEYGGYDPAKWLEEQLGCSFRGEYDRIGLFKKLYRLAADEPTKLESVYAGMMRRSLHDRLVVKDGGDWQKKGKAAAMMGIAQWFVGDVVDRVNNDHSARIEKRQANVKKRLDALKKKKAQMKEETNSKPKNKTKKGK